MTALATLGGPLSRKPRSKTLDEVCETHPEIVPRFKGVVAPQHTTAVRVRDLPAWAELVGASAPEVLKETSKATKETITGMADWSRKFGPNYVQEEETIRNDHSAYFVDTSVGLLPGNAVRNGYAATRFAEYPKLRRLVEAKIELVESASIPPTYLHANLRHSLLLSRTGDLTRFSAPQTSPDNVVRSLSEAPEEGLDTNKPFQLPDLLPAKYDVIVVDPPLEAYEWEETPVSNVRDVWSWADVSALPIPRIAAKESFIFLWVGSGAGDGLERGREVLMRWGYRRCEDITWVQTNAQAEQSSRQQPPTSSVFARSVQHCLMGIRGTVRRSNDTNFVHCNVDTDVILWEGERVTDGKGSSRVDARAKPPELYTLIENFCLGTRRLELFGRNRNLRRGWLTIGTEVGPDAENWNRCGKLTSKAEPYDSLRYSSHFARDRPSAELGERLNTLPYSAECDNLRPKTPPLRRGGPIGPGGRVSIPAVQVHLQGSQSYPLPSGLSNRTVPGWSMRPPSQATSSTRPISNDNFQQQQLLSLQNQPLAAVPQPSYYHNAGNANMHGRPMTLPLHTGYGSGSTRPTRSGPGGAGLSGLGAGGPRTMSVPSGSETLSGPQASVLQQMRGTKIANQTGIVGNDVANLAYAPPRTGSMSPRPKLGTPGKSRIASE